MLLVATQMIKSCETKNNNLFQTFKQLEHNKIVQFVYDSIKKIILFSSIIFTIVFRKIATFYDKISIYSFEHKNTINEKINENLTIVKKVIGFLLISYEFYSIIAQPLTISLWILANLIATILFIYHNLSDININKRIIKIGFKEIRLFFCAILISGIFTLLWFHQVNGILPSLFMFYLLNRSYQLVF